MALLLSCILLNAVIVIIFKLFHRFGIDNLQAIVVNYFVCVGTAAVVAKGNPIPTPISDQAWFWYVILLGLIFIIVFNSMAMTVRHFGVVISSIFQKMSLLAPSIIAILVYGEQGGIIKWLGIMASVAAIVLLSYESQESQKNQETKWYLWMFPVTTFLGSCVIDASFYLLEKEGLTKTNDIGFVAALFLCAGVYGILFLAFQWFKKSVTFELKNIAAGIVLGVPNFFSIYLLILLLQQGWGGSVLFPINNVGILVVAVLAGSILFKEKMSAYKIAGFILAIVAILLISFF